MSDSELIAFRRWRPKKLLCFVYQLRPSIPNIEFLSVKMTLKLVELDDISKSRFCEQKARRISMKEFFSFQLCETLGEAFPHFGLQSARVNGEGVCIRFCPIENLQSESHHVLIASFFAPSSSLFRAKIFKLFQICLTGMRSASVNPYPNLYNKRDL